MPEWTPALEKRLEDLWHEGLSTAAIGRKIGFSKNAVVGKVHRLGLPGRPSPIAERLTDEQREARRIRRENLATLPALGLERPRQTGPSVPMARTLDIPPAPRLLPEKIGRVVDCCWPIGEPGRVGFHFCGCKSAPGRPYCEEHHRRSVARVRRAA